MLMQLWPGYVGHARIERRTTVALEFTTPDDDNWQTIDAAVRAAMTEAIGQIPGGRRNRLVRVEFSVEQAVMPVPQP